MKKISVALAIATILIFCTNKSSAQVNLGISITANIAPPPLPVYVQPACPTDGYLWSPGYWAYTEDGYYWVPGVWVRPPQPGFLWTPGYWGFAGGMYGFHAGYWGPHVGFYGGVNYGYGYGGSGFGGGRWEGGSFRYNTAVVNVNRTVVHNTYIDKTVIVNNTTVINNRTSYNGGPKGISARATPLEQTFQRERHIESTPEQNAHVAQARSNPAQFASHNQGRPHNLAMSKPGGQSFNAANHPAAHQNPNPQTVSQFHNNHQQAPAQTAHNVQPVHNPQQNPQTEHVQQHGQQHVQQQVQQHPQQQTQQHTQQHPQQQTQQHPQQFTEGHGAPPEHARSERPKER